MTPDQVSDVQWGRSVRSREGTAHATLDDGLQGPAHVSGAGTYRASDVDYMEHS